MLPMMSWWSKRSTGESENSGSASLVVDGGDVMTVEGGRDEDSSVDDSSVNDSSVDGTTVETIDVVPFPFFLRPACARRQK